jgi:ABC-type multidrug transport system fused ATPase/permease subunit
LMMLPSIINLGHNLELTGQRAAALGVFTAFALLILAAETFTSASELQIGRRLEARFRSAFFEKIPRLTDRYFSGRPTSDMAERLHAVHQLRQLPRLIAHLFSTSVVLLATALALAVLDPASAPLTMLAVAVAIGFPVLSQFCALELDMRVRTHSGALSRFYLDAMAGLAVVQTQGTERTMRREHESLLSEWVRACRRRLRWNLLIVGVQSLAGFLLAGWLVYQHANLAADTSGALLFAYWSFQLPIWGQELSLLAGQYPIHRNVALRVLEPLGALEESVPESKTESVSVAAAIATEPQGVGLVFERVTVQASGHTLLSDVSVAIDGGSQIGIVGKSGAGKSTLVGLLLGWHRAFSGRVLVDGQPLDAAHLDRLRNETAWLDPEMQLWNTPLIDNLQYGLTSINSDAIDTALREADLYDVVQRLPQGMQTPIGEGGRRLSGGEGQRVRIGRALLRNTARLVILDEPFRGLDRERRRELLSRFRRHWPRATILCVTHDVADTQDFERVLVVDQGRIVEDGQPSLLRQDPKSHYSMLIETEDKIRSMHWSNPQWRRLCLKDGNLIEDRMDDRQ